MLLPHRRYKAPETRPNFGKPTPTGGDDATPTEATTDKVKQMLEISHVGCCSFGVNSDFSKQHDIKGTGNMEDAGRNILNG